MNKTESIARRILGWKLYSTGKWYDHENEVFIDEKEFQPNDNLDHAMLIVKRLEHYGYQYIIKGDSEVCFNNQFHHLCGTGNTLAEAITNAAHLIADQSSPADEWL